MHLRKLPFSSADSFSGQARQWNLYALAESDGSCSVEEFLHEQLQGGQISAAEQLLAFLDDMVFDERGPQRWIGTPRCHESVAGKKIFEFKQGRLRVHWFYGQGHSIVILARGALKQTNATPKQLSKELIALKYKYEEAAKSGHIKIVNE
jgi:hypothetical protein